jgi:hypothetical protein
MRDSKGFEGLAIEIVDSRIEVEETNPYCDMIVSNKVLPEINFVLCCELYIGGLNVQK